MWEIPEQNLLLGAPYLLCSFIQTGRQQPQQFEPFPSLPSPCMPLELPHRCQLLQERNIKAAFVFNSLCSLTDLGA